MKESISSSHSKEEVVRLNDEEPIELADSEIEYLDHEFDPHELLSEAEGGSLFHATETLPPTSEIQKMRTVPAVIIPAKRGLVGGITMSAKRNRPADELNEDCVLAFDDAELGTGYGSFDGLGGEGNGARASETAVHVLPEYLKQAYHTMNAELVSDLFSKLSLIKPNPQTGIPEAVNADTSTEVEIMKKSVAISEALKRTNKDVIASKGKTTACFTLIHTTPERKRFAITANVGDGGAILRRADGSLVLLTKEDSALSEAIEEGLISEHDLGEMKKDPRGYKVKGATYELLKRANSQALGKKEIRPKITITELSVGDEIYNVTDGILDFYENESGDFDLSKVKVIFDQKPTFKERIDGLREIAEIISKSLEKSALKTADDSAITAIQYKEVA
jgi:serine/threonine protein phosphatase PrpC